MTASGTPDGRATVALRPVTVIGRDGASVTLADGLKAGERVAVAGAHSLEDGQAVRLPPSPL